MLEVTGLTVRQGGGLKMTPAAPQHKSGAMGRPRPEGCRKTCRSQQQLDSMVSTLEGQQQLTSSTQHRGTAGNTESKDPGLASRCARHRAVSMSLPALRYI